MALAVFIVNIDSGRDEQYAPGKGRERKEPAQTAQIG
jgi:hypothetical protein